MSNVTLQVGGRGYIVACAAGEEAHVEQLGVLIDGKIRELTTAGHNEVRLLLFASLLLADELHELKGRASGALAKPAVDGDQAAALEQIATRLENCATALER